MLQQKIRSISINSGKGDYSRKREMVVFFSFITPRSEITEKLFLKNDGRIRKIQCLCKCSITTLDNALKQLDDFLKVEIKYCSNSGNHFGCLRMLYKILEEDNSHYKTWFQIIPDTCVIRDQHGELHVEKWNHKYLRILNNNLSQTQRLYYRTSPKHNYKSEIKNGREIMRESKPSQNMEDEGLKQRVPSDKMHILKNKSQEISQAKKSSNLVCNRQRYAVDSIISVSSLTDGNTKGGEKLKNLVKDQRMLVASCSRSRYVGKVFDLSRRFTIPKSDAESVVLRRGFAKKDNAKGNLSTSRRKIGSKRVTFEIMALMNDKRNYQKQIDDEGCPNGEDYSFDLSPYSSDNVCFTSSIETIANSTFTEMSRSSDNQGDLNLNLDREEDKEQESQMTDNFDKTLCIEDWEASPRYIFAADEMFDSDRVEEENFRKNIMMDESESKEDTNHEDNQNSTKSPKKPVLKTSKIPVVANQRFGKVTMIDRSSHSSSLTYNRNKFRQNLFGGNVKTNNGRTNSPLSLKQDVRRKSVRWADPLLDVYQPKSFESPGPLPPNIRMEFYSYLIVTRTRDMQDIFNSKIRGDMRVRRIQNICHCQIFAYMFHGNTESNLNHMMVEITYSSAGNHKGCMKMLTAVVLDETRGIEPFTYTVPIRAVYLDHYGYRYVKNYKKSKVLTAIGASLSS